METQNTTVRKLLNDEEFAIYEASETEMLSQMTPKQLQTMAERARKALEKYQKALDRQTASADSSANIPDRALVVKIEVFTQLLECFEAQRGQRDTVARIEADVASARGDLAPARTVRETQGTMLDAQRRAPTTDAARNAPRARASDDAKSNSHDKRPQKSMNRSGSAGYTPGSKTPED